jgi:hypothetical protein
MSQAGHRLQYTVVWCKCILCWIPKPTNAHQNIKYLIIFHCSDGCTNMSHCYDICALPVLLICELIQVLFLSLVITF